MKVNVYDDCGVMGKKVIARVNYNNNLDFWDGHNMTNGGTGCHKGLTRLKNGSYVLIHGTQWVGGESYGEIISKDQAIQEILRSNNLELFEKYPELEKIADSELIEEEK
jgi:hypothetical protein